MPIQLGAFLFLYFIRENGMLLKDNWYPLNSCIQPGRCVKVSLMLPKNELARAVVYGFRMFMRTAIYSAKKEGYPVRIGVTCRKHTISFFGPPRIFMNWKRK